MLLSLVGEREFVKDNKSLGNFRLDGIPPAPRGVPQVEVKFDIDANGILSVTATDKGTQKKQDIKITGASTLNSDEVDRMVQEAEKYSEEDKKKREAVDVKNQVCAKHYHVFGDQSVPDAASVLCNHTCQDRDRTWGGVSTACQEINNMAYSAYTCTKHGYCWYLDYSMHICYATNAGADVCRILAYADDVLRLLD